MPSLLGKNKILVSIFHLAFGQGDKTVREVLSSPLAGIERLVQFSLTERLKKFLSDTHFEKLQSDKFSLTELS